MTTEHQENDYVVHSGEELNLPKTFPKVEISKSIKKSLEFNEISIRKLAEMTGMKHPQIVRITSGDTNYNIDTLIKILDVLDLKLVVCEK
ncbi:helix-turn-helix transcriptional regulator [Paenibacillus sp. FSL H7-0716]|uniref:HTH cro/C1-type domain-containing protein n=1 Tax=Paenibacillus odorifer TaxID=189426 RepID=A0AB36JBJ1_9BACL|nr:helix-turn-helix transcriptional regulator [Paenibacillus odorifer]OME16570.1 hypothetical protein BSK47_20135 [Paenibacillus odorifer]